MPELPEVETTIRYLREVWLNRAITEVIVAEASQRQLNVAPADFTQRLTAARLTDISRYGKWMLFDFEDAGASSSLTKRVVGHLRMSGNYKVTDSFMTSHPHLRFGFALEDGKFINYLDQRRFGTWHFVDSHSDFLSQRKLGVDALSDDLNSDYLFEKLHKLAKPIYAALLDQSVIAGLGNIYVNELLHITKINPLTPAKNLPKEKVAELVKEIPILLNKALSLKGTTLTDNLYNTPEGKTGEFAALLKVYGQHKQPEVNVIKIGGRSVFYTNDQLLY